MTKIIMVDDNVAFRKNLKKYIEESLGFEVIAEASDGRQFLKLLDHFHPDIILMDIAMDEMDGLVATKKAIWGNPKLKIIAVTMHQEKVYLLQLIEVGFKGCVFKPDIFNHLNKAIVDVMNNNYYIPANMAINRKDQTNL